MLTVIFLISTIYHACTSGFSFTNVLYFEFVRLSAVGFGDLLPEDEMTLAGAKIFALCSEDTSMHENLKKTVKAIILQMENVIQRVEHGLQKPSLSITQNCEQICCMVRVL